MIDFFVGEVRRKSVSREDDLSLAEKTALCSLVPRFAPLHLGTSQVKMLHSLYNLCVPPITVSQVPLKSDAKTEVKYLNLLFAYSTLLHLVSSHNQELVAFNNKFTHLMQELAEMITTVKSEATASAGACTQTSTNNAGSLSPCLASYMGAKCQTVETPLEEDELQNCSDEDFDSTISDGST